MRRPTSTDARFWPRVNKNGPTMPHMDSECWTWVGAIRPDGYGHFMMGSRSMLAHRAAMVLVGNIIPLGSFVCHKCDNKSCVNPGHLFIGSHRDNMRDMRTKGRGPTGDKNGSRKKPDRMPRGEGHVKSKLTNDAVVAMRRLWQAGMSQREIAERFGVSRPLVSLVVRRKLWAHVQ